MKAIITPQGLPAVTVDIVGEPSWSDNEIGGWGEATFTAKLDQALRERLYDAEVSLVASSQVYFGFVKKWDGDEITCEGWYERARTVEPRAILYADDSLAPFADRTYDAKSKRLSTQVDGTVLRFVHAANTAGDAKLAGMYRLIPTTEASRITCSYKRGSSAHGLSIWAGTYSPSADNGIEGAWSLVFDVAAGDPTLTGAVSQQVTGSHDMLMFAASAATNYTPGVDVNTYFHSIKVWGTGWAACTADAILADVEAALPSRFTPAPSEIDINATAALIPSVFDSGSTEPDRIDHVLDSFDALVRFEARTVNGVERPAFIARERDLTPTYTFDAKREQASITGGDLSTLCSHVRVQYADAVGNARFVDVEATSGTLRDLWYVDGAWVRERWQTITADTTSATVSTSVGTAYLSMASREQVRGTLTVSQPVNGVPPSEIQAGRICVIKNTERGVVVAHIKQVDHTGDAAAVLTLDNTPTFEDLLTRWQRTTTRGRFTPRTPPSLLARRASR